jgi:4a-hydroxytetrahydrobiopterin dehydratase
MGERNPIYRRVFWVIVLDLGMMDSADFARGSNEVVKRERLSEEEISRRLSEVPSWQRDGDAIVWTRRFPAFLEGIAFVGRVAQLAEAMDHHPDIDIRWRRVRLALSTHSSGGLTALDFELARRIDSEIAGEGADLQSG